MALQLVRSTRGIPFQTCRGGGRESWESNTQCAPNPLLANQDKEILEVWFYSCKAEKCPEIPLQTCKGGEEKVGNPTQSTPKPPLSKQHKEILGVWFYSCPRYLWVWCKRRQSSNRTNLHVARALGPTCLLQKAIQISLVSSK